MKQITVELSLYPLADDFIPPIVEFVRRLKAYKELDVVTNAVSTQIVGDHKRVFEILSEETERVFSEGSSIVVMKIIGFGRDIHREYCTEPN